MKFNETDRVQVMCSADAANPVQHMGEIGTVVKPGDGLTIEGMVTVQHDNGYQDSYWPEELELC